jgi:cysteine-rich repeat protein
MRIVSNVPFVLAVALFGGCILGESQQSDDSTVSIARLAGAIFTTLPDGTRVDANIYADKDDVYLDGGPGNQAPSGSAALPEGDYYFQVTDPSGQVLLSQDAIECRRFHVDASGLISAVGPSGCSHVTGIDVDHGALTVQLMPYADTPNPGGEYKAWVTKVSEYDIRYRQFFGFNPSESKTDNYKIREEEENPPPPAPYCGDGNLDAGEQCDDGNNVDGDGYSATCCTELPPPPPPPVCGDGHLDAGEQCDDGNTANGDGCDAYCVCETSTPPTSEPTEEGGSGTITDPIIVQPLKDRVIFHTDSIYEYELSSGSLY